MASSSSPSLFLLDDFRYVFLYSLLSPKVIFFLVLSVKGTQCFPTLLAGNTSIWSMSAMASSLGSSCSSERLLPVIGHVPLVWIRRLMHL